MKSDEQTRTGSLAVSVDIATLVNEEVLPGTAVSPDTFWEGLEDGKAAALLFENNGLHIELVIDGNELVLPGRSLMQVRDVGMHMTEFILNKWRRRAKARAG